MEYDELELDTIVEKLIATIRSREISACVILQSQAQLKSAYKDNADTIAGNCDTTLFLGGKEKSTLKEMSEILGKWLGHGDIGTTMNIYAHVITGIEKSLMASQFFCCF